jgi:hypothetical protein
VVFDGVAAQVVGRTRIERHFLFVLLPTPHPSAPPAGPSFCIKVIHFPILSHYPWTNMLADTVIWCVYLRNSMLCSPRPGSGWLPFEETFSGAGGSAPGRAALRKTRAPQHAQRWHISSGRYRDRCLVVRAAGSGCTCAWFERPWLSQRILKASALGAAPKLPAKSVVVRCRSVLPYHGVVQVIQLSNAGTKKRGHRGVQCCSCKRPSSTHAGTGAQYGASWRGTLCGLSREMCR